MPLGSCSLKLRLAESSVTIESALLEQGLSKSGGSVEFTAVVEQAAVSRFPLHRCKLTPGLYIAEVNNHRVTRWGPGGSCEIVVGGFGRGAGHGQVAGPKGLCFNADGVMYIAEAGNRRVTRWCLHEDRALAAGGHSITGNEHAGQGPQVEEPSGICMGSRGEIYVAGREIFKH